MQRAALTDLTVPPPGSVEDRGATLGEARAFYTTTDTVADLEPTSRSASPAGGTARRRGPVADVA
jgi:hypothetical protein